MPRFIFHLSLNYLIQNSEFTGAIQSENYKFKSFLHLLSGYKIAILCNTKMQFYSRLDN